MAHFSQIDLRQDPVAGRYTKDETVSVAFARIAGALDSREGLNHYAAGDALVCGFNGDRWSVTRARFDLRYEPIGALPPGADGAYRARALPVLARQIDEAFSLARSAGGDVIHGHAGDWLLQYAPGDYGIVENAKFQRVYRRLPASRD